MTQNMLPPIIPAGTGWRLGIPSASDVLIHEQEHGFIDRNDALADVRGVTVSLWAAFDPHGHRVKAQLLALNVDCECDDVHDWIVQCAAPSVELDLVGTRWAARSYWRPVNREGVPVEWPAAEIQRRKETQETVQR